MIKKTITYNDYSGETRTEDFYFNLTRSEITELEMSVPGGLLEWIKTISSAKNGQAIIDTFKTIIFKAYGEKSADGRRFVKSLELSTAFSQTEAYDILFMELILNPDKAAEFFNGVIPQEPMLKN